MELKQIINAILGSLAVFFALSEATFKLFKLYKTKDATSYSYSYLFIYLCAMFVMETFQIGLLLEWVNDQGTSDAVPLESIIMQLVDIMGNVITIVSFVILVTYKFLKKNKFLINFKKYINKEKIIISCIVVFLVACFITLVLVLQRKTLANFKNETWINIFSLFATILFIIAGTPQALQTIITRDTRALSVFALFCFLTQELMWFGYDFTQLILTKNSELLPELIEDFVLLGLGLPLVIIKFINLKKDNSSIDSKTSFKKNI